MLSAATPPCCVGRGRHVVCGLTAASCVRPYRRVRSDTAVRAEDDPPSPREAAAGAFSIPHVTMATHFSKDQEERIRCVKGDLFSCPATDALAHCISEDCRMGAGIAVLFKKKFGGVQELLDQKKKTGEVAVLQRDERYIYYLITKQKVSHKPTYENMQKSLEAMKAHCLNNGVTDISMPRIGCGLDGLQWEKVSAILEEVFDNTDIKITVYSL
ncbi:ADP-ribose glycohydrolase OARD1 isoform 1-T1 [Sylvia borin]